MALGFLSCVVLMFSLPSRAWAVGAVVMALDAIYYRIPALRLRNK